MPPNPRMSVGYSVARRLQAARPLTESEALALDRLVLFLGDLSDVERLESLASSAGIDWRDLFPELE